MGEGEREGGSGLVSAHCTTHHSVVLVNTPHTTPPTKVQYYCYNCQLGTIPSQTHHYMYVPAALPR